MYGDLEDEDDERHEMNREAFGAATMAEAAVEFGTDLGGIFGAGGRGNGGGAAGSGGGGGGLMMSLEEIEADMMRQAKEDEANDFTSLESTLLEGELRGRVAKRLRVLGACCRGLITCFSILPDSSQSRSRRGRPRAGRWKCRNRRRSSCSSSRRFRLECRRRTCRCARSARLPWLSLVCVIRCRVKLTWRGLGFACVEQKKICLRRT